MDSSAVHFEDLALPEGSSAASRGLFDESEWVSRADVRAMGGIHFITWGVASAELALRSAGLMDLRSASDSDQRTVAQRINDKDAEPGASLMLAEQDGGYAPWRFGVSLGTGIGCLEEIGRAYSMVEQGRQSRVSPFFVPRILPNMAAGHVGIRFGLRGPALAPTTACAAGSHAIGEAFRLIQAGDADAMVAGATESAVHQLSVTAFGRARALSRQTDPQRASRPFDRDRDGFVMGEGSVMLVLEEMESAVRRGAPILAELAGFGMSCDASHITAPPETGSGAWLAMRSSIVDAGLCTDDVDAVIAHATSTPLGDSAETAAISALLAGRAPEGTGGCPALPRHGTDETAGRADRSGRAAPALIASAKGAVGHMLGAAGAANAATAIDSIVAQAEPRNRNADDPSVELDQDVAALSGGRPAGDMGVIVSNAFGFGGTNAALVFARPGLLDDRRPPAGGTVQ